MKKIIFIVNIVVILLLGCTISALADSVSYPVEQAGYYVYVATPDGGLNIRSGPGVEYDRVMDGRIPDDVKLYITHVSGTWGLTTYNGYQGWVALKQTTTQPPANIANTQTATPAPKPTPMPAQASTPTPAPTPPTPSQQPVVQVIVQNDKTEDSDAQELEKTSAPEENVSKDNTDAKNSEAVIKRTMFSQIVLIAVLIFLVVMIAILTIIAINLKSKKR